MIQTFLDQLLPKDSEDSKLKWKGRICTHDLLRFCNLDPAYERKPSDEDLVAGDLKTVDISRPCVGAFPRSNPRCDVIGRSSSFLVK